MGTSDFWLYFVDKFRRRKSFDAGEIRKRGKNPNPENLAARSANAKSLLINPTFNQAYSELLQQIQDSIAETKIEESALRESLYFQIRALVLVVTKLNHFAQAYELKVQQDKENKEHG